MNEATKARLRQMNYSCIDSSLRSIINLLSQPERFHCEWQHADDGRLATMVERTGSDVAISNAAHLERAIQAAIHRLRYIENESIRQDLGKELIGLQNEFSNLFGEWPSDITSDEVIYLCSTAAERNRDFVPRLKQLRASVQLEAATPPNNNVEPEARIDSVPASPPAGDSKKLPSGNDGEDISIPKLPKDPDQLFLWNKLATEQGKKPDTEIADDFSDRIGKTGKTVGREVLNQLKTARSRGKISDWKQK